MTADERDERLEEAKLSIFIPASQAAVCADCGGIFLLTAGHCPGCSSKQWILLEPAQWVRESMNKAGGEG